MSRSRPDPVPGEAFERLAIERVSNVVPNVDSEAMSLVYNVVRLANRMVADIESQVHSEAGWSWAGFRIMFVTLIFGELEPRQISTLSDVSRASVSSVLNTLERDGLVVRLRESEDRRLVTVRLTEHGTQAVMKALIAHNDRERSWALALTPEECVQLTDLVRKVLAGGPTEG